MNQSNNPRSTGRNQSKAPRAVRAPVNARRAPKFPPLERAPRRMKARSDVLPVPENAFGGMTLAPAAQNSIRSQTQPRMSSGIRSKTYEHTEFIGDVFGEELFSIVQSIPLNPGLPGSFRWLSTQASGWEQYRFKRLEFHFLDDTGSSTAGNVMLVPDYDAADPPPVDKIDASTYQDVKRAAPWKSFSAPLDPSSLSPMGPRKFLRSGPLAANLDIKTYDAGTLFVATSGSASSHVYWGELWVSYEVELFVPQTQAPGGNGTSILHATSLDPTSGNLLPDPTVVSGSLGVSVSTDVITLPNPGVYGIQYRCQAVTSVTLGTAVLSGCALVTSFYGASGGSMTLDSGTDIAVYLAFVKSTVSGATITLPSTLVGTGEFSELFVDLLPNVTA